MYINSILRNPFYADVQFEYILFCFFNLYCTCEHTIDSRLTCDMELGHSLIVCVCVCLPGIVYNTKLE